MRPSAAREGGQRKADDGEVVAVDALDERRGEALDPVGAGLVAAVAAGDVGVDHGVVQRGEAHAGADGLDHGDPSARVAQGEGGVDLVAAAGQRRQHRARIVVVPRLAECPAVEVDDRVGADRQVR